MSTTIAFLAKGKLFVKRAGAAPEEIESAFAREAEKRAARSQQVNGWKSRSGVWGNMGMAPPQWSQWEAAGEARRMVSIRSISRGQQAKDVLYILDLESVSGVFRYDLSEKIERRLMHRNGFIASDLACHRDQGTLAISLRQEDGSAALAYSEDEGRHWNPITAGDSVDQAPAWAPGAARKIVFQSAGVGRTAQGHPSALAPYVIECLDLDQQSDVTTLVASEKHDLLLPKYDAAGTLYFIRRPYKPQGQQHDVSFGQFLHDVLMLPFRLLATVYYIFNFFSMMLSGQPLATAFGRPQPPGSQQQFMMLWGHMVDAKRMLAKAAQDQPGALVPKDWELVARTGDGKERVVAQNVLAYDLSSSGALVYTNGSAVIAVNASGEKEKLCDGALIESVVWVE